MNMKCKFNDFAASRESTHFQMVLSTKRATGITVLAKIDGSSLRGVSSDV